MPSTMKVVVYSAKANVRIEFKAGGILTEPDGTISIDGTADDGTLYTTVISGADTRGMTFEACLRGTVDA